MPGMQWAQIGNMAVRGSDFTRAEICRPMCGRSVRAPSSRVWRRDGRAVDGVRKLLERPHSSVSQGCTELEAPAKSGPARLAPADWCGARAGAVRFLQRRT